ncbi:MAG TPA: DUF2442 domain-containing protein [Rhizomicrobium sp.]|jgi:hypothetical protein|nr:DUF2442 domain-containing protein [Rhizomicrobium sp.]
MTQMLPNIVKVEAQPGYALRVKFRDGGWREIALEGFLARYKSVATLRDAAVFAKAKVIDWGAAAGWPGDVAIGADTLWRLSQEQSVFGPEEFAAWQERVSLSNQECADVLGVALSTIKCYRRKGTTIPDAIAIACRAMENEPMTLAAHFRPRRSGRPKAA